MDNQFVPARLVRRFESFQDSVAFASEPCRRILQNRPSIPNPARCPNINSAGARSLSDYLLSAKVQSFMASYGKEEYGGISPFHPVYPYSEEDAD